MIKLKVFLLYLLFIFSNEKIEEVSRCDFSETIQTGEDYSLNYCKNLTTDDGNQCCVGAIKMGGDIKYFCDQFTSIAKQDEIDEKISIYEQSYKSMFPELNVEGIGSCEKDVKPVLENKCSLAFSETSNEIKTCDEYIKNNKNNFCCLFKAKFIEDTWFCNEFESNDKKNIDLYIEDLSSKSSLRDIENINCSEPEKDDQKSFGDYIRINILSFLSIFIGLY